jgi:hypothetical protein
VIAGHVRAVDIVVITTSFVRFSARLRNLGREVVDEHTVQVMLTAPADRPDSVTGLLCQRGAQDRATAQPAR